MSRIKSVYSLVPSIMPSTVLSIIKPMISLDKQKKIKHSLGFSFLTRLNRIKTVDVVIFCRNFELRDFNILKYAKQNGKKIIYDIDDNFYAIPVETQIGRYHREPTNLFLLDQFIKSSDIVRVYSKPMYDQIKNCNNNVIIRKSYFDFSLIDRKIIKKDSNKVRIVYATSRGRDDELYHIFSKPLKRILEEYPDRVEFHSWGFLPDEFRHLNNAYEIEFEKGYELFIDKFRSFNYDIGLAPLIDDIFHNSKTNNKYREYGAMKVAGLYSKSELYCKCIRPNVTGLLVSDNENDWYNKLYTIINDNELRNSIKESAFRDVNLNYSFESFLQEWEKDLHNLISSNDDDLFDFTDIMALFIVDMRENEKRYSSVLYAFQRIGVQYDIVLSNEVYKIDSDVYNLVISFSQELDINLYEIFDENVNIILDCGDTNHGEIFKHPNVYCVRNEEKHTCNDKEKYIPDFNVHSINKHINQLYDHEKEECVKKSSEVLNYFYSRKSPVYMWLDFISGFQYEKKELRRFLLLRKMKNEWKITRYFYLKLRAIKNRVDIINHKVKTILYYINQYLKINYFKKV